jgi:hypothetical protein
MKGQQVATGIVAVMVIFAGLVIGLAYLFSNELGEGSRVETVPIVEKRIESVLYTMSAVEKGSTTVKLGDSYGLEKDNGEVLINYTAELTIKPVEEEQRVINPPVNFSIGEEGVSDRFCVSKSDSDLELSVEAC